ncbi:F0F1 ATP synthase subunit B family protein [Radicibacter daui]|uniref:F0F1 ATP synthase subunit B family protein n=1 Tax=Radicibacter daui TaxID=3064829 RepID=UPI004046E1C3
MAEWIQDAHFWYFVAFAIFVVLVWKKVATVVPQMLDSRAEAIRKELDEAAALREEAQARLAEIQQKSNEAEREAELIVAHAREEAERLRKRVSAELELAVQRREEQALAKIHQAEAAAAEQVRNVAVDLAVNAATRVLSEHMKADTANGLIDKAIKELPTKLH